MRFTNEIRMSVNLTPFDS